MHVYDIDFVSRMIFPFKDDAATVKPIVAAKPAAAAAGCGFAFLDLRQKKHFLLIYETTEFCG